MGLLCRMSAGRDGRAGGHGAGSHLSSATASRAVSVPSGVCSHRGAARRRRGSASSSSHLPQPPRHGAAARGSGKGAQCSAVKPSDPHCSPARAHCPPTPLGISGFPTGNTAAVTPRPHPLVHPMGTAPAAAPACSEPAINQGRFSAASEGSPGSGRGAAGGQSPRPEVWRGQGRQQVPLGAVVAAGARWQDRCRYGGTRGQRGGSSHPPPPPPHALGHPWVPAGPECAAGALGALLGAASLPVDPGGKRGEPRAAPPLTTDGSGSGGGDAFPPGVASKQGE